MWVSPQDGLEEGAAGGNDNLLGKMKAFLPFKRKLNRWNNRTYFMDLNLLVVIAGQRHVKKVFLISQFSEAGAKI